VAKIDALVADMHGRAGDQVFRVSGGVSIAVVQVNERQE
jgi:phosphoserine phosphatase